jgi:hypothetical protein
MAKPVTLMRSPALSRNCKFLQEQVRTPALIGLHAPRRKEVERVYILNGLPPLSSTPHLLRARQGNLILKISSME